MAAIRKSLLLLLFFGGITYSLSFGLVVSAHEGNTVEIIMTSEGFAPEDVEILVGDTVVFKNADTNKRWPASNIHPTHHAYPGSSIDKCGTAEEPGLFDACRGIESGEVFAFTFSHEGSWRYHDHLYPQWGGVIEVMPDDHVGSSSNRAESGRPLSERLQEFLATLKSKAQHVYYRLFPKQLEKKLTATDTFVAAQDEKILRSFLYAVGPDAVMKDLVVESGGSTTIKDCHQEAHLIGRVAYEIYGAEVFEKGTADCHSGFYHGAMEAFLAEQGTANLKENITELCAIFSTRFGEFECLHGVGHGIMAYESYDLLAALDTCDELEDDFSVRSCYGGVFMENIVAGQGGGAVSGHGTTWVSEDPHYPCSALKGDVRRYSDCYLMQTSWMLSQNGFDYGKVAQECLSLSEDVRPICFQSLGRDIAGNTLRDTVQINQYCELVPKESGYFEKCIIGALNVIVDFWGPSLQSQASDFCATVVPAVRSTCEATLEQRMLDFQKI